MRMTVILWLPTWLHFASAYGLTELVLTLLKSPASVRACFMRNNQLMKPIDIAIRYGHWDIVQILHNYTKQIEHIQHDLLVDVNHNVKCTNVLIENVSSPTSSSSSPPSSSININDRIIEAKNQLLELIEQFKDGISIEQFEQLFTKWESTYCDVLEGQMSHELLYSLGEIKKLCSPDVNDQNENDDDDDDNDCTAEYDNGLNHTKSDVAVQSESREQYANHHHHHHQHHYQQQHQHQRRQLNNVDHFETPAHVNLIGTMVSTKHTNIEQLSHSQSHERIGHQSYKAKVMFY